MLLEQRKVVNPSIEGGNARMFQTLASHRLLRPAGAPGDKTLKCAASSFILMVFFLYQMFVQYFAEEDYLNMPDVGDAAPDFELPSHLEKGKKVRLADFRGKNNVVLAFYPLAWTPV